MDTRKSTGSAAATGSTATTGHFKIRYGRTAIALAGLLSLLTAFVSAVLLAFGLGSPALPLACAALAVAGVVLLRRLAIRDRKAKVNAAFRSAMAAPAARPAPAQVPPNPEAAPGTTWEPVEVPKPVYVAAAKAERPAPEPLELPEAPKATGKPSLKQGAAVVPAAPGAEAQQLTKAQSALSNLDDVLQRRRA